MGRTRRKRKRKVGLKERNYNVSASGSVIELLRWMQTAGHWIPNCALQLTEFVPLGLRGLMAKYHVEPSDLLVRIPFKLLVTREVAVSFIKESNVFQDNTDCSKIMTTLELLAIFLLLNKKADKIKEPSSHFWKPYLDTLPDSYDVPYFCKDDEVDPD